MTDVNIRGNRVSPPVVSLSNRAPACGGASRFHQRLGHGEPGVPHPPPWWESLGVEARRRRASTPTQEQACSFWR